VIQTALTRGRWTKAALVAKKAAGASLGNRVNLAGAGYLARMTLIESADDLAHSLAPVLRAVRSEDATTLDQLLRHSIAGESNLHAAGHGIPHPLPPCEKRPKR